MVLRFSIFFYLFLGLISCSNNQPKKNILPQETAEQKGGSLFLLHCASCHGEDGKLGASGAKDLTSSRLMDKEIENIINNGKNAMPPMKLLLESKENIELVVKHVKLFRK
jgi:mono/diheme cytochrome c family protein